MQRKTEIHEWYIFLTWRNAKAVPTEKDVIKKAVKRKAIRKL